MKQSLFSIIISFTGLLCAFNISTQAQSNYIKIILNDGELTDETAIRFHPDAHDGFDIYYDAKKHFSELESIPQIYSIDEDSNYLALNSIPEIVQNTSIPIGYKTASEGFFSLSLQTDQLTKAVIFYLVDLESGKEIRLEAAKTYTFYSQSGQNNSRFILKMVYFPELSSANQLNVSNSISVIKKRNELIFYNEDHVDAQLVVIDLNGQIIFQKNSIPESIRLEERLANQMVIVKIYNTNTVYLNKLIY